MSIKNNKGGKIKIKKKEVGGTVDCQCKNPLRNTDQE